MKILKSAVFCVAAASLLIAVMLSEGITAQGGGALEWKNYVIRLDRGWDILCEPYEVQPNDWVLKIFSQKGEISQENFREFLGIFARLNPHVKDIDRVRPGQIIDIPLKKLTQGELQGQSSGIVTIPFVTLNSVDDILADYSTEYVIRPGDCVSAIIARRFGIYGSNSYAKGFRMFQALNPNIENVDKIIAGQKIYVPAPSIQEQSWYPSMFDSQGNLTDKIGVDESGSTINAPINQKKSLFSFENTQSNLTLKDYLYKAADALDSKLLDKGTFFFPLSSGKDFELDLSRYPILEKKNGDRYLLTDEETIMGEKIELLKEMLPLTIIKLSKKQTADNIIDSLTADQKSESIPSGLKITEHGMEIWLQAKWIETVESQGDDVPQRICIMPIESSKESTSQSIFRYLLQHNVVLKEMLSNTGEIISAESPVSNVSARYTIVTSISSYDNKQFVSEFAKVMKWNYSPDVSITFPYADIQIQAFSNMLSSNTGQELLVDFEDLYGDAITSIQKNGIKIIQILKDDTPDNIVIKLLKNMNIAFIDNPAFLAAQRHSPYNTTIRIKGFLLNASDSQKIMFSTSSLNQKIVEFLEAIGVNVVMLGQSKLFY